jgi:hypothetical protein
MPENCRFNKNILLNFYFHELSSRKEKEIQKHVQRCKECQVYLSTLEQTNCVLRQWPDQPPLPNTLDLILEKIPDTSSKPTNAKSALTVTPFLKIMSSILAVLAVLIFLHHQVTRFDFWEMIQEWWFVKLFGSLGVTVVLFFLLGAFITLAFSPVLILESQSRKYKYYFSQ